MSREEKIVIKKLLNCGGTSLQQFHPPMMPFIHVEFQIKPTIHKIE